MRLLCGYDANVLRFIAYCGGPRGYYEATLRLLSGYDANVLCFTAYCGGGTARGGEHEEGTYMKTKFLDNNHYGL